MQQANEAEDEGKNVDTKQYEFTYNKHTNGLMPTNTLLNDFANWINWESWCSRCVSVKRRKNGLMHSNTARTHTHTLYHIDINKQIQTAKGHESIYHYDLCTLFRKNSRILRVRLWTLYHWIVLGFNVTRMRSLLWVTSPNGEWSFGGTLTILFNIEPTPKQNQTKNNQSNIWFLALTLISFFQSFHSFSHACHFFFTPALKHLIR